MVNNQAFSGLFETRLPVLQGDTSVNIAKRLARVERGVKDWKAVEIYRLFVLESCNSSAFFSPQVG